MEWPLGLATPLEQVQPTLAEIPVQ